MIELTPYICTMSHSFRDDSDSTNTESSSGSEDEATAEELVQAYMQRVGYILLVASNRSKFIITLWRCNPNVPINFNVHSQQFCALYNTRIHEH